MLYAGRIIVKTIGDVYVGEGMPVGGNPCPDPEKPFPCKSSPMCIPMAYVCDQNEDCEDAYDEDQDVCTAGRSKAPQRPSRTA